MTYKKARLLPIVVSILFAAMLSVQQLSAQQLFFAKENYNDSLSLAAAIPKLAEQVIPLHPVTHKTEYYDNMFRYLLVDHQYDRALLYIDSVRRSIPPASQPGVGAVGTHYQLYIKAKLAQRNANADFAETFKTLLQRYAQLDGDERNYLSLVSSHEVADQKKTLDHLIATDAKKDTLSLADAEQLLREYNTYVSYSLIIPLMRPIITAEDNKTFVIDQVIIKTTDGSLIQAEAGRRRDLKSKLPTIFMFNIYIDSARDIAFVKRYASKGYACVVANTRGKGKSPQKIEPFEHDATDAYDIIDWISRQPWSNKKVGMTGGSYLGFSQWAAAKTLHPALKTIMPEVSVGAGIDYPMSGNVFMSYMLQWIHDVTNTKQTDDVEFYNGPHWDSTFTAYYKKGLSFRSLDSIEGRPNPIFQRWLQHPGYDSYWQNMHASADDFAKINIPVLTTTGYYDADDCGAMYYFREHYLHNPKANNYLVIGPYDHGGAQSYPQADINGYKVDSIATTFNFIELGVKWFDYILRDSAKPAILQDKVNYEVMGENKWRHAPSLAGMANDTMTLYLGNIRVGQHYKLNEAPQPAEYISQEVDFADRTDTAAAEVNYKIIDSIFDSRNAVSFVSKPAEEAYVVTGSFIGSLKAAINKKDMDISISLYEQTPDGKYFSLNTMLQRASYAKDRGIRQLLQPGVKETIPVTYSYMTCKKIAKGSRLLVVMSILKDPNWQVNYGTGKDVSDETIADAKEPLEIKWFADSYIRVAVWK
jgi:putative CocE/NonD family hydrolase